MTSRGILRAVRNAASTRAQNARVRAVILKESPELFDGEWYVARNADVRAAGLDPLDHFIRHGAAEGRDPSENFSVHLYLHENPDVAGGGLNPLAHYILHGRKEGRRSFRSMRMLQEKGIFDAEWYRRVNADLSSTGVDPLLHFILHGVTEGRDPSPVFSMGSYLKRHPEMREADINTLLQHMLETQEKWPPPEDLKDDGFAAYGDEALSVHGFAAVAEYISQAATPSDLLARPDPKARSPLISLILPIYNTPPRFLRDLLQSIFAQTYSKWEISAVDDGSTNQSTLALLDEYERDGRFKLQRLGTNAGIAAASHAALLAAEGDYVGFVDHDDMLAPTALAEVVSVLRQAPDTDYVYTDHVQANADGVPVALHRKPGWSPEFLLSTNYIVHFKVVRRDLLLKVGGIQHERANVQDLGMSLRLMRAGARVRHIPKPLYFWREHGGSVAASTTAKPGIEGLLVDAYNEHSRLEGRAVKHFWPKRFQRNREGVFAISFPHERTPTALVAWIPPSSNIPAAVVRERLAPLLEPHVALHVVSLVAAREGAVVLEDDAAVQRFLARLEAPYIVLVAATARPLGPEKLSGLTGYLSLDRQIGLVGGKVLNNHLRVKAGGLRLTKAGSYGLISGDRFDNATGHWFTNQVASNVDAVSARCMALRREDLTGNNGPRLHEWGELAGPVFSQDVLKAGSRIVYNPALKLHDPHFLAINRSQEDKLRATASQRADFRIFKELAGA